MTAPLLGELASLSGPHFRPICRSFSYACNGCHWYELNKQCSFRARDSPALRLGCEEGVHLDLAQPEVAHLDGPVAVHQ